MTSAVRPLASESGTGQQARFFYSPFWMVLVGLAARLLCIVIGNTYRFSTAYWSHWEMANLGYSLAMGHGFSAPFGGDTGPSAWTAPLYPWLISLAFRIFGVFSPGAAFAMLTFNSVFAALTSWTIFRVARRVFGERVAAWSGWVWALLPYSIYWSVSWVWETSLSAFLLSLLFMLTLEMEDDARLGSWFRYGALWGIVGLTNTSAVAWLPFSGCWIAYQLHRRGKRFLMPVVASALIFWAILLPWMVRNYSEFGKVIFVRGDFGVELRSGNNPDADGGWILSYHPGNNVLLYGQYKEMGEAAFDTEQAHLAKAWIAENPQRFLILSCRRFLFFWAGLPRQGLEQAKNFLFLGSSLLAIGGLLLAVKRRVHGVFLFLTLVVFYPLIYYFTFPTPRYRHAIDPELVILAVFLILQVPWISNRDSASSTIATGEPLRVRAGMLRGVLPALAAATVAFVLLIAFALFSNNFSLTRQSRVDFDRQLDTELDKAIAWIAAHPEVSGTNPPLMYMVADIEKMTGDPRLPPVLAANQQTLRTRYGSYRLTPFWMRFVDPRAPLPFITTYEISRESFDQRWFAYAIDPNRAPLPDEDLADLYSLTKYNWGARHHQVLGLIMYRDFNGPSEKVDDTLHRLCQKEARDQTFDFRVSDAYVQRNAFMIAAGQSELVRSRWIERILDNQNPDGSWNYCWYGWCRGVMEFGTIYPGHTTVQGAWALALLKYRYPQWIQQHYH
jgi:4-amino-4-deoxy-L-arabinose transferase-like glycosyltransferase